MFFWLFNTTAVIKSQSSCHHHTFNILHSFSDMYTILCLFVFVIFLFFILSKFYCILVFITVIKFGYAFRPNGFERKLWRLNVTNAHNTHFFGCTKFVSFPFFLPVRFLLSFVSWNRTRTTTKNREVNEGSGFHVVNWFFFGPSECSLIAPFEPSVSLFFSFTVLIVSDSEYETRKNKNIRNELFNTNQLLKMLERIKWRLNGFRIEWDFVSLPTYFGFFECFVFVLIRLKWGVNYNFKWRFVWWLGSVCVCVWVSCFIFMWKRNL